jgi:hypothetical protein
MLHCFAPQKFQELTSMKHRSHLLKKCAIKPLRHSIVLRCVVNSKTLQGSRFGKMFVKSGTEVFTSLITAKPLDVSSTLSSEFSLAILVSVEVLIFGVE